MLNLYQTPSVMAVMVLCGLAIAVSALRRSWKRNVLVRKNRLTDRRSSGL